MASEQFSPSDNDGSPALDSQELNFDIAGLESYYERRILGIGNQALSSTVEISAGE